MKEEEEEMEKNKKRKGCERQKTAGEERKRPFQAVGDSGPLLGIRVLGCEQHRFDSPGNCC